MRAFIIFMLSMAVGGGITGALDSNRELPDKIVAFVVFVVEIIGLVGLYFLGN